jgi:hypothetical protein
VIAWLTHHLPLPDGKLIGGAEMTDATILSDAPVEVEVITPDNWRHAMDFEKIVIGGTDLLNDTAMRTLAERSPTVLVHHQQTRTPARQHLISSAEKLICHTPRHLEIELEWTTPKASTWVISSHDVSQFKVAEKENFALWAARMHPQKGPNEAIVWAMQNELPLLMFSDKPRETVLEAMSRAKHFVFLPQAFDAEPRTLIEAVLSGCTIHTNSLAGITSIPNWNHYEVMAQLVTEAKDKLWAEILSQ